MEAQQKNRTMLQPHRGSFTLLCFEGKNVPSNSKLLLDAGAMQNEWRCTGTDLLRHSGMSGDDIYSVFLMLGCHVVLNSVLDSEMRGGRIRVVR